MGAGEREQRGSLPLIGELPTELTPPVPVGPRGTSAAFPCVLLAGSAVCVTRSRVPSTPLSWSDTLKASASASISSATHARSGSTGIPTPARTAMSRRAQLMNRMALDSARLQPRLAACATRGATVRVVESPGTGAGTGARLDQMPRATARRVSMMRRAARATRSSVSYSGA